MNVIAADMCTNARRVRKRWLPKIQSLLPDSLPATSHPRKAKRGGAGAGGQGGDAAVQAGGSPFELDLRQLSASYLGLEAPLYERRERDAAGEKEKEASAALLPHLQFAGSRGGGGGGGGGGREQGEEGQTGGEADGEERLQTEQPPDLPLSLSSAASSSSSSSSSHASPQPAETAPAHTANAEERGAEPLENSQ